MTALTGRQQLVLEWLAAGMTREKVAAHLKISLHTVNTLAEQTHRRLKARNTTHAVAIAMRTGILT